MSTIPCWSLCKMMWIIKKEDFFLARWNKLEMLTEIGIQARCSSFLGSDYYEIWQSPAAPGSFSIGPGYVFIQPGYWFIDRVFDLPRYDLLQRRHDISYFVAA